MARRRRPREKLRRILLGQLYRLMAYRWGQIFPEGDEGALGDLEVLLQVVALHPSHRPERIRNLLEMRAPWVSGETADRYVSDFCNNRRAWRTTLSRDGLREGVCLSNEVRERLKLWMIRPIDMTDSELKEFKLDQRRKKDRARRAKSGAKTRAQYLEEVKAPKPWEAGGISRRTWYRRNKRSAGKGHEQTAVGTTCTTANLLNIICGEPSASATRQPSATLVSYWETVCCDVAA